MPNAKDADVKSQHKIFIMGTTGAGKTSQFLTLPGKKFVYIFDPNALITLQGHDVDYEEFLVDQLNLNVTSLKKDVGDKKGKHTLSTTYTQWEEDYESKLASGFFNDYDWVGMDSFTTFSDLVMDRVLAINGRGGQWPQQDDYGPQMNTISNVVRTMTAMGKGLYFTGHTELIKDELSGRVFNQPVMTGRLKVKLPLLFSEILYMEAREGKEHTEYMLQTQPTRQMPLIRCTLKGLNDKKEIVRLEPFEDVTLQHNEPLEGQGLGGIINWSERK